MSFKTFIYYCALCGAWAAFFVWIVVLATGVREMGEQGKVYTATGLIAMFLGLLVAGAVGGVDAAQNAVGSQRMVRVLICMGVAAPGAFVGGIIGAFAYDKMHMPKFIGWILVGIFVGASIGVYDLMIGGASRASLRKTLNGIYGGLLGGFVGGLIYNLLSVESVQNVLPRSSLAIGLVILGLCIGLLIGLAQVILKEAWLKVEAGFKPGRELMLTKDETCIGRAESCDLGLFGDTGVEKMHARILLKENRYVLADASTPSGTYVNDQRVEKPTPLKNGDVIRVGKSILRFGERQKRNR
jgi:hypothetical protein